MDQLAHYAHRFSISGPIYKDGHRSARNIIQGSNIILIDCDAPGQAEAVEAKISPYVYLKVPSASNSEEKPYKWHFFLPTQEPLSIYPAAMRWQIERFFQQVGITDKMIDTSGSFDIARQFAPASVGMDAEIADELSEIGEDDLFVPVSKPPVELCSKAARSTMMDINGKDTDTLPTGHLWYQGKAITYKDAIKAFDEAAAQQENNGEKIILSGFGCPHDNHHHTSDRTRGYGFAFRHESGAMVIKCTGNQCKDHPYFEVPEPIQETPVEIVNIEAKLEPMDPGEFVELMRCRMLELNHEHHFSENSNSAYYNFGAIYNEVSNRNRDEEHPKRIIVPLSTGACKTVAAKV
jgi:hypothetical protein